MEEIVTHRCHVYRGAAEKAERLARFMADGLERNAQCRVLAYIEAPDRAVGALIAAGFDLSDLLVRDALDVIPARTTPLLSMPFEVDAALDWVRELSDEATSAGFASLRLAIEMRWALGSSVGESGLAAFERGLDRLTKELPLTALCQYDADAFPRHLLDRVTRAHSRVEGAGALPERPI